MTTGIASLAAILTFSSRGHFTTTFSTTTNFTSAAFARFFQFVSHYIYKQYRYIFHYYKDGLQSFVYIY